MAREQREQRAPAAVARKAPTVRRVASGILAFLILFYIGYQIWAANYESLKFETATGGGFLSNHRLCHSKGNGHYPG